MQRWRSATIYRRHYFRGSALRLAVVALLDLSDPEDVAVWVSDAHLLAWAGTAVLDLACLYASPEELVTQCPEVVRVKVELDSLPVRIARPIRAFEHDLRPLALERCPRKAIPVPGHILHDEPEVLVERDGTFHVNNPDERYEAANTLAGLPHEA